MMGGKDIFGNIEHVNGKFYIATQFYHLGYFPFIPIQSFIVIEGSETVGGFYGIKIPLYTKSVLMAYFRSIIVIFAGVTMFRALVLLFGKPEDELTPFLSGIIRLSISIVCITIYWASYVLFYADKRRADFLEEYIKTNSQG
jgi:hypothetical protein